MNHLWPFVSSVALSLCVLGLSAQKPSFDPNDNKLCSRAVHLPSDMPFNNKAFGFDCALEDERREKAEFAQLQKSIEQRSPEEIAAYESLVASFRAFYKLHERNEGCHGGSYCSETMELDHASMQHEFLLLAKAPIAGNTVSIKGRSGAYRDLGHPSVSEIAHQISREMSAELRPKYRLHIAGCVPRHRARLDTLSRRLGHLRRAALAGDRRRAWPDSAQSLASQGLERSPRLHVATQIMIR